MTENQTVQIYVEALPSTVKDASGFRNEPNRVKDPGQRLELMTNPIQKCLSFPHILLDANQASQQLHLPGSTASGNAVSSRDNLHDFDIFGSSSSLNTCAQSSSASLNVHAPSLPLEMTFAAHHDCSVAPVAGDGLHLRRCRSSNAILLYSNKYGAQLSKSGSHTFTGSHRHAAVTATKSNTLLRADQRGQDRSYGGGGAGAGGVAASTQLRTSSRPHSSKTGHHTSNRLSRRKCESWLEHLPSVSLDSTSELTTM